MVRFTEFIESSTVKCSKNSRLAINETLKYANRKIRTLIPLEPRARHWSLSFSSGSVASLIFCFTCYAPEFFTELLLNLEPVDVLSLGNLETEYLVDRPVPINFWRKERRFFVCIRFLLHVGIPSRGSGHFFCLSEFFSLVSTDQTATKARILGRPLVL